MTDCKLNKGQWLMPTLSDPVRYMNPVKWLKTLEGPFININLHPLIDFNIKPVFIGEKPNEREGFGVFIFLGEETLCTDNYLVFASEDREKCVEYIQRAEKIFFSEFYQ